MSCEYPNAWQEVLPGKPPVFLNTQKVNLQTSKKIVKSMQQVQVEKNYQRCATGIYQEVQDVQKNILHEHDQD